MQKILCLIESLGGGGAERQLTGLAVMLKERGYDVNVWYHDNQHFYVPYLQENGIEPLYLPQATDKKKRYFVYSKRINALKPDVVISFTQSTSYVVCLMKALGAKFELIVSERNTTQNVCFSTRLKFFAYRAARYVVPNSYSQGEFIEKYFPALKDKIRVITNFTDLEKFHYVEHPYAEVPLIIVAATIWASKNTLGFIEAVRLLKQRGVKCHIKWYGYTKNCQEYYDKCKALVEEYRLEDYIELLPKTQEIDKAYREANFFCLPSFYEGTPNVICEAMASGLPVVCSDVCDNSRYVLSGENGYLFNPKNPDDIADTIEKVLALKKGDYEAFSTRSREIAEGKLSKARFIREFIEIIEK